MIFRFLCYLTLACASFLGLYGYFAHSERHLLASISITLIAIAQELLERPNR